MYGQAALLAQADAGLAALLSSAAAAAALAEGAADGSAAEVRRPACHPQVEGHVLCDTFTRLQPHSCAAGPFVLTASARPGAFQARHFVTSHFQARRLRALVAAAAERTQHVAAGDLCAPHRARLYGGLCAALAHVAR
jgi:hypothetical protein